jgi:hypothetical protein
MAYEDRILDLTFPAEEDLSNDQYRIVVLTSTGTVRRPDAATDIPIGVLQNAPAVAGQAAVVRVIGSGGVTKIQMGATVATGAIVAGEYVSATDAGKAIAAVATMYPIGVLVQGGAEDDLGSLLLSPITVKA